MEDIRQRLDGLGFSGVQKGFLETKLLEMEVDRRNGYFAPPKAEAIGRLMGLLPPSLLSLDAPQPGPPLPSGYANTVAVLLDLEKLVLDPAALEEKASWVVEAGKYSGKVKHLVLTELVKQYIAQHPPVGLDTGMQKRTAQLPGVMSSVGDFFGLEERMETCVECLSAINSARRRVLGTTLGEDQRKEGTSCVGLFSMPGGGKTSLSRSLPALIDQLAQQDDPRIRTFPKELLDELSICARHKLIFRYDWSWPLNNLQVDKDENISPEQSLALRILYMLRGKDLTDFKAFITELKESISYHGFLSFLTLGAVMQALKETWKDERAKGMVMLIWDEIQAAHDIGADDSNLSYTTARQMLSHWDQALLHSDQSVTLVIAGTRLDLSLHRGGLQSASGCASTHFVSLPQVSREGLLNVAADLLGRATDLPDRPLAQDLPRVVHTLAEYSGGNPRMFEALLAAACLVIDGPSDIPVPDRWNVDTQKLVKVLQWEHPKPEQLQQVCIIASDMLSRRMKTLEKYLTVQYWPIGKAIVTSHLLGEEVSPDGLVQLDGKDVRAPRRSGDSDGATVTWGTLQGHGLVCLAGPASFDDPNCSKFKVFMPFLLLVRWIKELQKHIRFPVLPAGFLFGSWDHTLVWQQKERLDVGVLICRMFIYSCWLGRQEFTVAELLRLKASTPIYNKYAGFMLKAPTDFTLTQLKYTVSKQDVDFQTLLQEVKVGKAAAFLGPGNAPEPDWWVVLKVDQAHSTGSAKNYDWLFIEGQSKQKDIVGASQLKAATVRSELDKRFTMPKKAATIFVLVTDELVPSLPVGSDIILIGSDQHQEYYGPGLASKREAVSHCADQNRQYKRLQR